jgi:hypothetical protein
MPVLNRFKTGNGVEGVSGIVETIPNHVQVQGLYTKRSKELVREALVPGVLKIIDHGRLHAEGGATRSEEAYPPADIANAGVIRKRSEQSNVKDNARNISCVSRHQTGWISLGDLFKLGSYCFAHDPSRNTQRVQVQPQQ